MANTLLRDGARLLRSDGASLNEISKKSRIPKSTVRYWCRDIVLSSQQHKRLYEKQKLNGIRTAEQMRKKRLLLTKHLLETGIKEVGKLSSRELFLAGISLYWAEGYKKGNEEFGFTNSDPKMIKFTISWLQKSCKVSKDKIKLRICINAVHKRRIKEVQKFWSKITDIPASQFSKPTLINIKNKKKYLNSSEYFGTLRIKVSGGTNLRRKIMGWIEGISRN